jgi:hypothetical protein
VIDYKYPTIASGATPIGSAGRAPDEKYFKKNEEENFESIVGGKHQKINSTYTPIGRADSRKPDDFGHSISQTRCMKSKIYEAED